jgi:hypothetical protein
MWGTLFRVTEPVDRANIRSLLRSEKDGADYEEQIFTSAGWSQVADTGILAMDFDGELLLGIHGCGYDFHQAHWEPLYDVLGYRWHE